MSVTPRAQIDGKSGALLLDLQVQGLVLRFTSAPEQQTVLDADGNVFEYVPGMTAGETTLEVGTPFTSYGIEINTGVVDWAELRARGHRFDVARATVRRYYTGQTIEQAQVVIVGRVVSPRFGDVLQPFRAGVERQLRQRGTIPAPDDRIGSDTWPQRSPNYRLDEAAVGQSYVIPFGFPGRVGGDFGGPIVPVFIVEWGEVVANRRATRGLFARGEVHASHVTLYDVSTQEPDTGSTTLTRPSGVSDISTEGPWRRPVITASDKKGKTCSLIDWTGTDLPTPSRETDYRIAFDRVESGVPQGGILNRTRTAPMRGAGEIIRYLLEEWTDIEIDVGRMEAQRAVLDAYKLDFVIGSRTRVWDYIRTRIAPLLPVEWRETREGGYFQTWRLDADYTDVRHDLIATRGAASQNCSRTSEMQSTAKQLYNRVTVNYARSGQQQAYLRTVIGDAKSDPDDERVVADFYAAWSQSIYSTDPVTGVVKPRDLIVNTDIVFDDNTARLILQNKLLQHAVPRMALSIDGGSELDSLDLNDVVTFTDDSLYLNRELAIVRAKTVADRQVGIDLLLLGDPTKTTVRTS